MNFKDVHSWTPIMWACRKGHKNIVQLLIDHSNENIDFNARIKRCSNNFPCYECDYHGNSHYTPLMLACKFGHQDVVQLLIEQPNGKIDFNAKAGFGCTSLMLACKYGKKDVVKLLLDHSSILNIDLHAKDPYSYTAFSLACQSGHTEVVQLFLDHSEKEIFLSSKNDFGLPAIDVATIRGEKQVAQLLYEHYEPRGLLQSLYSLA